MYFDKYYFIQEKNVLMPLILIFTEKVYYLKTWLFQIGPVSTKSKIYGRWICSKVKFMIWRVTSRIFYVKQCITKHIKSIIFDFMIIFFVILWVLKYVGSLIFFIEILQDKNVKESFSVILHSCVFRWATYKLMRILRFM